jgi:hypothetical protein
MATICGQSVSCCLQISTLQCSQFFSPPAFILTISCFFQLWAPAQKILVFRLVKRSFSYTEICLPVPISSGNDYIPEAYIYKYKRIPHGTTIRNIEHSQMIVCPVPPPLGSSHCVGGASHRRRGAWRCTALVHASSRLGQAWSLKRASEVAIERARG